VKRSSKRLKGERVEVMGLSMHNGTSFICVTDDCVTIHFPRKRYLSVLITHTIHVQDRGAKFFESLKDFEICGVLTKELRFNGQDSSIQSSWLFARSIKNGIGVITRWCYQ
jgi:hypothetical protein